MGWVNCGLSGWSWNGCRELGRVHPLAACSDGRQVNLLALEMTAFLLPGGSGTEVRAASESPSNPDLGGIWAGSDLEGEGPQKGKKEESPSANRWHIQKRSLFTFGKEWQPCFSS